MSALDKREQRERALSLEHKEHVRALLARLNAPAGLPPAPGGGVFEAASGDAMRVVCFRIAQADKQTRISTLRLHDQAIRQLDDLELLCATLDGLGELDHLDLSGCTLFAPLAGRDRWQPREQQARASLLCVLSRDRLRTLELRSTGLGAEEALALVSAVQCNGRLQFLGLACNGAAGAEEQLRALWEQYHSAHGLQLA